MASRQRRRNRSQVVIVGGYTHKYMYTHTHIYIVRSPVRDHGTHIVLAGRLYYSNL